MKSITVAEYHSAFRAQRAARREQLAVVCPMCGTVQTAQDLIDAGAGKTFDDVEGYFGFSCIGRFTGKGSPRKEQDGQACNWTLGGLLQIHKLEVATPDGRSLPRFEAATPEQASEHLAKGGAE